MVDLSTRAGTIPYPKALLAGLTLFTLHAGMAAGQGSLAFYPITPCRLVDSADANGVFKGQPLTNGQPRNLTPLARCGISTWAQALSVNVTVDQPSAAGYISLLAAGTAGNNNTTVLNYKTNRTRANNAIVGIGTGGQITAKSVGGTMRFIIDVSGYFADPAQEGVLTAPPVFEPPPGSYSSAQLVEIRTSTPGAVIRYTLDGSTPTTSNGTVYTGAVLLAASTNLRAIAYVPTQVADPGSPNSGTYSFSGTPTLLLATLVPQTCAGVTTLGAGSATLMLAPDLASASLRYNFSNLTGAIVSQHIHGPNTQILFDIDTAVPQADGSRVWTIAPAAGYDTTQIVSNLLNGTSYINLHTAACPSGEIKGFFKVANGSIVFTPPPAPPAPGSSGWAIGAPTTHIPTQTEAARFLMQTTFGGTLTEINALTGACPTCSSDPLVPYRNWLNAQFALPQTPHVTYTSSIPDANADNARMMESFWKQALTGPDQLRQRVAFALSEMLVISDEDGDLYNRPDALATYLDLLGNRAFKNFRDLLEDVAKSPAMGVYLDSMSNDKEDPATGQRPDENFAREILQLFTVGLYKLNPDGSLLLDQNGYPQATYNQAVVEGFAKVFTGWTLADQDTTQDWRYYWPDTDVRASWRKPMQQWVDTDPNSDTRNQEVHHSTSPKLILDGVVLPANQSGQLDFTQALDAIFAHPNVGPFLCRGLIQRLVTSNPSPGYVYRCAQAFANNGSGVRGDMKAVLSAILLDFEARSLESATKQGFGKLKEPDLRLSAILRALGLQAPSDGIFRIWNLESVEWAIDQNPLRAPTVFNFFSKDYSLPGAISSAGLYSPEFQIDNETTAISGSNYLRWAIWDGVYNYETDSSLFPAVDWNAFIAALPGHTLGTPTADAQVVDRLSLLLTANAMSKDADADHTNDMYTILIDSAAAMRSTNPVVYWPPIDADCNTVTPGCAELEHLKELVWLVITSPEGAVQR